MKRNSLMSTNLKDYSSSTVTNSPIKEYSSYANHGNKNQMVKQFWDCNSQSNIGAEDYMNGFPWPPRSYTCSFCRKEFKSAQALGGHMNVHRRDKARLRQSPPAPTDGQAGGQGPIPTPMLNLNLNPTTNNPNFSTTSSLSFPSSSSSLSSANLKPVSCTLPLFVSPTTPSSQSSAPPSELKTWVVMDGILLNPLSTKTSEPTKSKIAESLSGCGEYGAFAREDGCKMLKKDEILSMDMEIGLPSDYDLDLELRLGTYS